MKPIQEMNAQELIQLEEALSQADKAHKHMSQVLDENELRWYMRGIAKGLRLAQAQVDTSNVNILIHMNELVTRLANL